MPTSTTSSIKRDRDRNVEHKCMDAPERWAWHGMVDVCDRCLAAEASGSSFGWGQCHWADTAGRHACPTSRETLRQQCNRGHGKLGTAHASDLIGHASTGWRVLCTEETLHQRRVTEEGAIVITGRAWRGCGHTTAGLTRKSVGAKQRCSNTTQKQGNHRAITVGSYETIHESTMISGRRVSACVWCEATADSGAGVVKHQRALEMKCWFQEPKPKPSAQNTVTRSKKSSFGDLAHMS